jgi:hypothetical protein
MPSSWMWRHVGLIRADVSEERVASTLKMEAVSSSKTLILTRATRHHTPEDGILHSPHCENLKSYII